MSSKKVGLEPARRSLRLSGTATNRDKSDSAEKISSKSTPKKSKLKRKEDDSGPSATAKKKIVVKNDQKSDEIVESKTKGKNTRASKRKKTGTSSIENEVEVKKTENSSKTTETPSSIKKRRSSFTDQSFEIFMTGVENDRTKTATSIVDFDFRKKRARVISEERTYPESDGENGVLYWMFRDQRIHDNWAFLYAQKLALKFRVPLHVCFCRLPNFSNATIRQFDFMFKGLEQMEKELNKLDVEFHFLIGRGDEILPEFVINNKIGSVVVDFCPLRGPQEWTRKLAQSIGRNIPVIEVDAHNIVPCWIASEKKEYAARTIRNKINFKLKEFLTQFPPVIKHPFVGNLKAKSIDWATVGDTLDSSVDRSVKPVEWAVPGYNAGMKVLYDFLTKKIANYNTLRNDPTKDAVSNLSPWLHFGQISAQRCVLMTDKLSIHLKQSVEAFREEIIVRRELSDNFCLYNVNYDTLDGAEGWARETLNKHSEDKREHIYSQIELEQGKTHDKLWNAAQMQLSKEGKMHGFLRMYWAKKILEWTRTPEMALSIAIYLNDKYSMDGRDPNGYVGCMWSICGIHDQGWGERNIFGKIRFMNYEGCKRKFPVDSFISRYSK